MCGSCEALMINGVLCHEHGCHVAWMDEVRECKECGCDFKPESSEQQICSEECCENYYS